MSIVIEVFEPGRKSPSIKRFSKPFVSIGRAWHSDLIIADEEVDADHLQVTVDRENQQLLVTDIQSTNGSYLHVGFGSQRLKHSQTLDYGQKITIGQTSLCIHHIDTPVAPVKIHSRTEKFIQLLSFPSVALLFSILALITTLYNTYLSGATQREWDSYAHAILLTSFVLLLWSLVWGTFAKLTKHRFMIWAHLSIAALLLVIDNVFQFFIDIIAFNTLSLSTHHLLSATHNTLLFGIWVWVTLQIMTHLRFRTKFILTGLTLIFFSASAYILPYFDEDEWQTQAQLETTSLPPSLLFIPPIDHIDFSTHIMQSLKDSQDESKQMKTDKQ